MKIFSKTKETLHRFKIGFLFVCLFSSKFLTEVCRYCSILNYFRIHLIRGTYTSFFISSVRGKNSLIYMLYLTPHLKTLEIILYSIV